MSKGVITASLEVWVVILCQAEGKTVSLMRGRNDADVPEQKDKNRDCDNFKCFCLS